MPSVPLLASICPTSPGYPQCPCSPSISSSTFLGNLSVKKGKHTHNNLLNCPRFTSLVTIARIISTSTIISTIMSVIAAVGVRIVYISSRRKKCSMRLNMPIIFSSLALASLAACEPRCQISLRKRYMKDTDQEENANPRKDYICRWKSLKVYVKAEAIHDKISDTH